jgi:hypothetical protein
MPSDDGGCIPSLRSRYYAVICVARIRAAQHTRYFPAPDVSRSCSYSIVLHWKTWWTREYSVGCIDDHLITNIFLTTLKFTFQTVASERNYIV